MKEWISTRHCPDCNSVELVTSVTDDEGRVQTWCSGCGRVFRKYDTTGEFEWEDPEWADSEEQ